MTDALEIQELLVGELDDWIEALPTYQAQLIRSMLNDGDPAEVAMLWLSTSGPSNTAPFGAVKSVGSRFYENLLIQMKKLICDDEGYEDERGQLIKSMNAGKLFLVGAISAALAPHVGAAAAVIAPAVALTLAVLSATGKATACETLTQMIADRQGLPPDQAPPQLDA